MTTMVMSLDTAINFLCITFLVVSGTHYTIKYKQTKSSVKKLDIDHPYSNLNLMLLIQF